MKKCMMILFLVCLLSLPASAVITHRYDFTNDANDVVGGLVSTLAGNAAVSGGSLVLDGTDDWLELDGPGIAINTYSAATMEAWYTPVNGGNPGWSMLACFGNSSVSGSLTEGIGVNYWFMTAARNDNFSRAAICTNNTTDPWATETGVNTAEYDDGLPHHMVATLNGTEIGFFLDGEFIGTAALSAANNLADVSTVFALLGKGTYSGDPEWNGSITEFRIYDKALSAAEVRFTSLFGADNAYPIVLRSMTPADGSTWISTTPILAWTPEPDITVDSYTLYVGTDPNMADPNIPDISGISKLVVTGLTTAGYTIPEEDRLPFDSDIYWRVDTVAGATTYQGVGSSFTTIPETPAFWTNPETNYVFTGETATFTAECESISPVAWLKWYKVGTPDTEVTMADPDVTIVTTTNGDFTNSTLTIANVAAGDAGSYYAKAQNASGPANSASAKIVIKKLMAYWPFDNNLNDASGNGYNGTGIRLSTGEVVALTYNTAANSVVGTSVNLTGTQYIDLVDGLADNLGSGLTFTFWTYPTNAAAWSRFLCFNNGTTTVPASDNIFFSREGTSTTLHFNVYDNAIGTGPVTAANAIALNVWQMFTVTVDETGATVLYKNGAPIATGEVDVPNTDPRVNNWIGRSAWTADALYRGRIDDMRIYNYALTPTEIATLYTNVRTTEYICVPDPENPLAYDFTGDCRVNLDDLAVMVESWIDCMRIPDASCDW
jgi:hypothetical protein